MLQLMLQYVDLLLASSNEAHNEMAQELMLELNAQEMPADADMMREIETKVPSLASTHAVVLRVHATKTALIATTCCILSI